MKVSGTVVGEHSTPQSYIVGLFAGPVIALFQWVNQMVTCWKNLKHGYAQNEKIEKKFLLLLPVSLKHSCELKRKRHYH